MQYNKKFKNIIPLAICLAAVSCTPVLAPLAETKPVPESFDKSTDTTNVSSTPWRTYFKDPNLVNLIDTALKNNQELQITLQEIEIAKNDIRVRKGALLPTVGVGVGAGIEKVGRYTSQGAGDASMEIKPARKCRIRWRISSWRLTPIGKLIFGKNCAIPRKQQSAVIWRLLKVRIS